MSHDVRERFVHGTSNRPAAPRREPQGLCQTFHGPANDTKQMGIAVQFETEQITAAQLAVPPLHFKIRPLEKTSHV
jgi:hypothetical protein